MDNFHIDFTCEGKDLLTKTMELVFYGARSSCAIGYVIHDRAIIQNAPPTPTLIFLWSDFEKSNIGCAEMVRFPFKMDAAGSAYFVQRWLDEVDYGPEPDHDGSNTKGWHVFNDAWGHVHDLRSAIIGIRPAWAMHGK